MKWFTTPWTQRVGSFMVLAEGVLMSTTEIPNMRENSRISTKFLLHLLSILPSENYENIQGNVKINVIWQQSYNHWPSPDIYHIPIELVFVITFYNWEITHILFLVHIVDTASGFWFCFVLFALTLKLITSPHQCVGHLWLLIFSFPISKIYYSIYCSH